MQDSEYIDNIVKPYAYNFGVGQPSPQLLPALTMQRSSQTSNHFVKDNGLLLQYGAGQGYKSFRQSLARFLTKRYGSTVTEDELLVTGGNSMATLLCATLPDPSPSVSSDLVVFCESPTYFLAHGIFKSARAQFMEFPTDRDGVRVDLVEKHLETPGALKPTVFYLIPTFHNPTGACLSQPRKQKLIALANKYNFLVIADEPYNMLSYDGKTRPSLAQESGAEEVVISLGTFSKILAPGLRLGWAHAHPSLISRLARHGVVDSGGGTNPIASALVQPLLDDGSLDSCVDNLIQVFGSRLKVMLSELKRGLPPSVTVHVPTGGYFLWLSFPPHIDCSTFKGKGQGVNYTAGSLCSLDKNLTKNCLRLSFAFYEEEEIVEGIKRLCHLINTEMAVHHPNAKL